MGTGHSQKRERNNNTMINKQEQTIEDEFDILEDTGDHALIHYYNEVPSSPTNIPIADKLKQGITNLGFMLTANGSKKVNLMALENERASQRDTFMCMQQPAP